MFETELAADTCREKIQFAVFMILILLLGTVNLHMASNVFFLDTAYYIPDISTGERGLTFCVLGCYGQIKNIFHKLHLKQITFIASLGARSICTSQGCCRLPAISSELLPGAGVPDSHSPKCQIHILK